MKTKIIKVFLLVGLLTGVAIASERPGGGQAKGETMEAAIVLPAPDTRGRVTLEQALAQRQSHRQFQDRPLTLAEVSQVLWAAQGVTAPRGRRTAPSAGATYPLETYLVAGQVDGLRAGVYRYEGSGHRLVQIQPGDLRAALSAAGLGQRMLATAPATVVLAAIYQRTAARYGERARRYVHMEIGHAGQNIYLQAQALGLGTVSVGAFRDAEVKSLLRVPAEPLYLMPLGRRVE